MKPYKMCSRKCGKIPINTKVWDSDLLLKKTFGEGKVWGGDFAIHSVHYFFLKLGEYFHNVNFDNPSSFNFLK